MKHNYIRKNIQEYYKGVEMPGGWTFNHVEMLKTINRFAASQYEKGQYDSQGFYKFFYNISKVPIDIARKFIDLDTANLPFIPEGSEMEFKVWVLQRRFKRWLKDSYFATFLNDVRDDYPKYGSVVVKKVKGKFEPVSLENLRFKPSVKWLKDSPFVYEVHLMSKQDIEGMNWKNKESLFERKTDKEGQYVIYECYLPKGKDKWKRMILGSLFCTESKNGQYNTSSEAQFNDETEYIPGIELDTREDIEFPYRELHWERMKGRWLGVGIIELLLDPQIAVNEAENLERKGLYFTSLHLWQTRDENLGGSNVLQNTMNGQILLAEDELTQVPMEERNLPAYNATRQRWESLAERLTFSTDISQGVLPSRTPVGTASIQFQQIASFFDELKRENFAIFIKNLIQDDVIPEFEKDSKEDHKMTFLGTDDELEILDIAIRQALEEDAIAKYVDKTGFYPSTFQLEELKLTIEEDINRQRNRYLEIPKGFYKDAKYDMDVNIVGEAIDTGAKSQTMQMAFQMLGTNPGILQNKTLLRMFMKFLAFGGVSPVEMGINPNDVDQTPVQQGGSIAAPQQADPQLQQVTQAV